MHCIVYSVKGVVYCEEQDSRVGEEIYILHGWTADCGLGWQACGCSGEDGGNITQEFQDPTQRITLSHS